MAPGVIQSSQSNLLHESHAGRRWLDSETWYERGVKLMIRVILASRKASMGVIGLSTLY